jgi:phage-related protein
MRTELVPSANVVGREIGSEISKGIMDSLDIGKIITDSSAKSIATVRASAAVLGSEYGNAMRARIDLALRDITAKVKLEVDASSLVKAREVASIASSGGSSGGGGGGGSGLAAILGGLIGRGGSSGGGAASAGGGSRGGGGGGGSTAGGFFARSLLPGGTNPITGIGQTFAALPAPAQIGAIGAAIAALPFIAQIASSGIVFALGGALAGLGIAGAAMNANVKSQFADLQTNATADLQKIGTSFVPVVESIIATAQSVLRVMTPVFQKAIDIIAGPFKLFADTIVRSFASPAVRASIEAIASAFGDLLKAFTPDIPGLFNSFAQAITRLAEAVAKNPKAFADFLNFLFQIAIAVINALAYLTDAADYIEFHFMPAVKDFADFWVRVWRDVEGAVVGSWGNVINFLRTTTSDITSWLSKVWGDTIRAITGAWRSGTGGLEAAWSATASFFTRIWQGISNVVYVALTPARSAITQFTNWWRQNNSEIAAVWNNTSRLLKFVFVTFWNDLLFVARTTVGLITFTFSAMWNKLASDARIAWNIIVTVFRIESAIVVAIFRVLSAVVELAWNDLWNTISGTVRIAWGIISAAIRLGWNTITLLFQLGADEISGTWRVLWTAIETFVKLVWIGTEATIKSAWDLVVGIITVGLDLLTGRWSKAWNDVLNVAKQIWNNIRNFFAGAGTLLLSAGENIIGGLLQGMKNAIGDIGNWINNNIVQPIINAVKSHFKIGSPSVVMMGFGENIIQGLIHGMLTAGGDLANFMNLIFGGWPDALANLVKNSFVDIAKLPAAALSELGKLGGSIGSFFAKALGFSGTGGVGQWAGTVAQALAMLGLPLSLTNQVLTQISSESGGNPNAINLTDINAQQGDPSRGLLQTIGSTFAAYHVAGTSSNIYDPLANIAAAINYARNVYGPSLMRGGMGLGSGHGYDNGGYMPPGAGWFWNGTSKPEPVLSDSQWNAIYSSARGGDGGVNYIAHFDSLTGAAIESHVRTAYQAMAIAKGHLERQGRRS